MSGMTHVGLAELFALLWHHLCGRRCSSVGWEENARGVNLDLAVDDLAIGEAGFVGDFLVGRA